MIPNTMFRPMVVTMMKKVKSKKTDLNAASLKLVGKLVVYMHTCDEQYMLYIDSTLTDPSVSNRPYSNTVMKH